MDNSAYMHLLQEAARAGAGRDFWAEYIAYLPALQESRVGLLEARRTKNLQREAARQLEEAVASGKLTLQVFTLGSRHCERMPPKHGPLDVFREMLGDVFMYGIFGWWSQRSYQCCAYQCAVGTTIQVIVWWLHTCHVGNHAN